jgi:formate-dependent nitrite reductase membrane component NrfD
VSDLATYYDRPVLKEPVWIWTVPLYFFAGGAAGASAVIGAAARASGRPELRGLARLAHRLSAVLELAGAGLLIADLGRPGRFLNMLRVFRPTSPLSVGSWVLAASAPLTAASAVVSGPAGEAAGYAAGALGLPLAAYSSVLLSATAVPVWSESARTLPVAFVGSAAAGAASLLELASLNDAEARVVRRFGFAGRLAELTGSLAIVREASSVDRVGRPYREGLSGALIGAARALTGGSLLVSLAARRSRRASRLAAGLSILGSLALRFGVFRAGWPSARDPRATFELQRRS